MNKKAFLAGYTMDKAAALNTMWENECRLFGAYCKEAGIVDFTDEECKEYITQSLDKTASSEDRACMLFMEGYLNKDASFLGFGEGGSIYDTKKGEWGGGDSNPLNYFGNKSSENFNQRNDVRSEYKSVNEGKGPTLTSQWATPIDHTMRKGNEAVDYVKKIPERAGNWMKDKAMGAFSKWAPYLAMGAGGLMMLMGGRNKQQGGGYPQQGMMSRGPMAMYNAGQQTAAPSWRGGGYA